MLNEHAFAAAHRIISKLEDAGYDFSTYTNISNMLAYNSGISDYVHYSYGASRLVLWDDEYDYVVKIATESCFERYCVHEVEVYEAAIEEGIDDYFGACACYIEPIYEIEQPGIYVMEFLDGNEEQVIDSAYLHGYEAYCADNKLDKESYDSMDSYDNERDDEEEVLNYLKAPMGYDILKKFNSFLSRWHINDLHSGNMLYKNGQLVICDYAGWNW